MQSITRLLRFITRAISALLAGIASIIARLTSGSSSGSEEEGDDMPTLGTLPVMDAGMERIDVFGGLHRAERIAEGEWREELNLTADHYPMFAVRDKRCDTDLYQPSTTTGIETFIVDAMIKNGLFAILLKNRSSVWQQPDTMILQYGSGSGAQTISIPISGLPSRAVDHAHLVSMGAYILVIGLNYWYNTADGTSGTIINASDLDPTATITDASVDNAYSLKLCPCDENGEPIIVQILMSDADAQALEENAQQVEIDNGKCYANGSQKRIRRYTAGAGETWQTMPNLLRVEAIGIGTGFEVGDVVNISGLPTEWTEGVFNDDVAYDDPDSGTFMGTWNRFGGFDDDPNGYREIAAVGTDYIVLKDVFFTRLITANATGAPAVSASSDKPDMDFVIECQNRLWGCYYGEKDGKIVNEIYASELGSFRNWRKYDGTSMASYAASVGSDGPFTGAINYNGYPHFFKEDMLHKVYVSASGAHQIQSIPMHGVRKIGSLDRCVGVLHIQNGILYYNSPAGICAYDGSTPVVISDPVCDRPMNDVVIGGFKNKLYISGESETFEDEFLTYDIKHGVWHKENHASTASSTISILSDNNGCVYHVHLRGILIVSGDVRGIEADQEEDPVEWSCTSGLIGYATIEQKYVSRFDLRLILPRDSVMDVWMEYDSEGEWKHQGHLIGQGTGSFVLPVRPRRCDHFRIRLTGTGDMKMFSFAKMFQGGSDYV